MKMSDLVLFEETFKEFNIFPQYSRLFTITIPSFEIVAGACLIVGIFTKTATLILLVLIFSFTIAIGINFIKGYRFDCGCFGPLEILSEISIEKILFNILLIICLFIIFFRHDHWKNILTHMKLLIISGFLISLLLYIPFSNIILAYEINKNNIKDIDWEEAFILVGQNDAILFDTRPFDQFNKEHVTGAFPLPYMEFDRYLRKYNKLVNKDSFIILYCDGDDCFTSKATALKFLIRGYKNIFRVPGGFDAWSK